MVCIYCSIPHVIIIAGLYTSGNLMLYIIPCHSASYHPAYNTTSQHGYKSIEGSLNSSNTLAQQENLSVTLYTL